MEDESNPWPSFVDTFSTVLCIFIFLMLVFALNNMIIMYDNSIKVYKANIENKTKSTAQNNGANDNSWICPYISRHLLSLNPLLACCRRYSRGER